MTEQTITRKNKITLKDYDYQRDIENRLLMAQLDACDILVLEEILYDSITIPIKKLLKSLSITGERLLSSLKKIEKTGLFTISAETLVVDKEMRKYYESQLVKFSDDFKPGMDYLQGLLRKVPIHVLPSWYAIPRTSNNIFDSIVEKYLYTPQIFQRYLMEINFEEPILTSMMRDVYQAKDCSMPAQELISKYRLSKELFAEYMLLLEFNFVACLGYKRSGEELIEVITPFQEWADYLHFIRNSVPESINNIAEINHFRPQPFSFVQDMATLLTAVKKSPIPVKTDSKGEVSINAVTLQEMMPHQDPSLLNSYLNRLIQKLCLIRLAEIIDGKLYPLESAGSFLEMREENRALHLLRHPMNQFPARSNDSHLYTDRNLRETEKTIQRVLHSGWVLFDDFIKGLALCLSENSTVVLKKIGKTWKYALPEYTQEEYAFIKTALLEWLYEAGVVIRGTYCGKSCFCVTPFGQSLFGK